MILDIDIDARSLATARTRTITGIIAVTIIIIVADRFPKMSNGNQQYHHNQRNRNKLQEEIIRQPELPSGIMIGRFGGEYSYQINEES